VVAQVRTLLELARLQQVAAAFALPPTIHALAREY
jgi:hypothetical protein